MAQFSSSCESPLWFLCRHIHARCSPCRVEETGTFSLNSVNNQDVGVLNALLKHLKAVKYPKDCHLMAFRLLRSHAATYCELFPELIQQYFTMTSGIGGFNKHVIVLPAFLCRDVELCSVGALRNFLCEVFDPGFKMCVYTSHNVEFYDVQLVVIHVDGIGKYCNCETRCILPVCNCPYGTCSLCIGT